MAMGARVWQACQSRVAIARAYCDCTADWLHLSDRFSHFVWPTVPNGENTEAQECLSLASCSRRERERMNCLWIRNESVSDCEIRSACLAPYAVRKCFVQRNTRVFVNCLWKYRFHTATSMQLASLASGSFSKDEETSLQSSNYAIPRSRGERERLRRKMIKIETRRFDVPKSGSIRSPPLFGQWACLACSGISGQLLRPRCLSKWPPVRFTRAINHQE